jgi:hypothetical protein
MRQNLNAKLNTFLKSDGSSIIDVVELIGNKRLTPTSHLYKNYGPIKIKDAALKNAS